jgi:hypothetical protein
MVVSTPSWAGDEALADSLFQEGQAAMKREDFKAACEAFSGSHKADPAPGTLINIGICSEKQHKYASAWSAYNGARELATQKGQTERATAAKAEAERLLPSVQKVQISVTGTYDGLVVKRDGEIVPNEALAFPMAIDSGKHHLDVTANGKKPGALDFEIVEITAGGKPLEAITIPALEDVPVEVAPPPVQGPVGPPPGSGKRNLGLIVAGAGLAIGLTSIPFFVVGSGESSKSNDFSPRADGTCVKSADANQCSSGYGSHHSAAGADTTVGIVAVGVGVVAIAGGAYLYFTAPKNEPKNEGKPAPSAAPRIVPALSPKYAGATFDLSF